MEIGIQISSVRKYLQTPEGVLDSFVKCAGMGYEWIQIQWISLDVDPLATKDALNQSGLKCVGTQDYTHEVLNRLDEVIAWNGMWGGRYICVSGIPDDKLTETGCAEFGDQLGGIAKMLSGRGITLQFHPRSRDIIDFGGKTSLDILLERAPDNFQMLPDIYHLVKAGVDPCAFVRSCAGRADMVHFKDFRIDGGKERLTPVGQGSIDWRAIYAACLDAGVKWCFAEQESWEKDAFECLAESYRAISVIKKEID